MKGVRELKARLKGVANIKKITRAMELVAATKLRRLQERALATRPFASRLEAVMQRVAEHVDPAASPLLETPEKVTREAVVVVGADRGLCGSYNSNLHRAARSHLVSLEQAGIECEAHIFGKRANLFLKKGGYAAETFFYGVAMEKIEYGDVKRVMQDLVAAFTSGRVQRVSIVSTRMKTLASFVPGTQQLLPVAPPAANEDASASEEQLQYLLEPSPQEIMDQLLPKYLEMQLFAAVLEALASEFASRRVAMKSATDNAQDMLNSLRTEYNKARQAGITGELLDIIGAVVGMES